MTTLTSEIQLELGELPRLTTGSWQVGPSDSHASFAARLAGRRVRGRLPLTGQVVITEPVEQSAALLTARTNAVTTGSPVLDRVLGGPAFPGRRDLPGDEFPH